jgi:hypothetical protein
VPLREHELTPEEELRISFLELTPGVEGKPFEKPQAKAATAGATARARQ